MILPFIAIGGLVLTYHEIKNETSKKSVPMPLSDDEKKAALKKWETTPEGIMFKKWEASPAGKKVYASEDKIRKFIKDYSNMEGVVTSLSLLLGSRLGFGVMVRINDADYILSFGSIKTDSNELHQLLSLKVNDKIIIKSRSVSHAPKYSFPIISGDYLERDNKIIYKRVPGKDNC